MKPVIAKTLLHLSIVLFAVGLFFPAVDLDPWLPGFNVFILSYLGALAGWGGSLNHGIACVLGMAANTLMLGTMVRLLIGYTKRSLGCAAIAAALTLLVLVPLDGITKKSIHVVSIGYWFWVASAFALTLSARAYQWQSKEPSSPRQESRTTLFPRVAAVLLLYALGGVTIAMRTHQKDYSNKRAEPPARAISVVADTPALSFLLERGTNELSSVVFSKDLKWLATRFQSGKVEVWDVEKKSRATEWQTTVGAGDVPTDRPGPLQFDQPQIVFLTNSTELLVAVGTNVTIHDLLTGKVIRILEPSSRPITSIALSPSGDRVVGCLANPLPAQLLFWSLPDAKRLTTLPTKRAPWEGAYAGRRRQPDGDIRPPGSIAAGFARAFSRDGRLFAVGLEYAQIDLWNLKSGQWLGVLQESEWYGRSSSGGATSLGFLGDEKLAAVFNEQELAVFTLGANQNFLMTKFSYTARGKTGEQIQGVLEASNRTAALFQVAKLGQGPIHVDEIKGVALTNGEPGAMITLLARPMMNPDSLEIRSLAVSGDGRRFAVAGMRMGKRQGVFQPAGTFVFDVPMHGEVQVWDAVGMKLLATLKGKPSEKFALVSLDGTGQRVAAVTTGVEYNSRMSDAAQQGAEWNPKAKASLRVCVWEVPVR